MASNRDIIIYLAVNNASLKHDFAIISASVKSMKRQMSERERASGSAMATAKKFTGALAGGLGLAALPQELFQVNKSFQDLKSGLAAVMGLQDAGDAAFRSIRQFAKETPYDLREVTTAFIKLKSPGLDPGNDALRAYGDIAAAIPEKSLLQFVDAVTAAALGQFSQLEKFGIIAQSQGNEVAFTFKGITETVKNNAAEIEGYLQKLAQTNFGGGMADKMSLLSGASSSLKNSLDALFVAIGEAGVNDSMIQLLRGMQTAIEKTTDNLDELEHVLKTVMGAAAGFGAARG